MTTTTTAATSAATTANQMKRKYEEADDAGNSKEPPMPAENAANTTKAAASAFSKVVPSAKMTLTSGIQRKLVDNGPASTNKKNNKSSLLEPPLDGGVGVGCQARLDESYFTPALAQKLLEEMALKKSQYLHKTQMHELYRVSYEHANFVTSLLLSQASIPVAMKTTKESEVANRRLLASYMMVFQNLEACNTFAMEEAGLIEREYHRLATVQNLLLNTAEGRAMERQATLATAKTSNLINHQYASLRQGDGAMLPGSFATQKQQQQQQQSTTGATARISSVGNAVAPSAAIDSINPSPIKKAKKVVLREHSLNAGQAELECGGAPGDEKESAKTAAKNGSIADEYIIHI